MAKPNDGSLRVQGYVSRAELHELRELARLGHVRVPAIAQGNDQAWMRAAVRLLAAFGERQPWFIDRAGKTELSVDERVALSEGNDASKVRVECILRSSDDRAQWFRLKEEFHGSSAAIRAALALAKSVVSHLEQDADNAIYFASSTGLREVPLWRIAAKGYSTEDFEEVSAAKRRLRGAQASLKESRRQTADEPWAIRNTASTNAHMLFSVLEFVEAFNLELVRNVALVVAGTHEHGEKALHKILELLKGYSPEDAERDMAERRLLRPHDYDLQIAAPGKDPQHVGREAVTDYLEHAIVARQKWTNSRAAVADHAQDLPEWRHWSRVNQVRDVNEMEAPLSWIAVIHHLLARGNKEANEQTPAPQGMSSMVAHDIQYWLLDAFDLGHYEHLDALIAVARATNQLFFNAAVVPAGTIHLGVGERRRSEQLLKTLSDAIGLELQRSSKNLGRAELPAALARAFYLFMVIGRMLRPVFHWPQRGKELVITRMERPVTSVEYSELRTRVFGAQTGIGGLHWILRGGIVPNHSDGRVWTIFGSAGAGKSTFSLNIAADIASRGRLAIFITTEEHETAVVDRLRLLGLDNRRYRILREGDFNDFLSVTTLEGLAQAKLDLKLEDYQGILVIVPATNDRRLRTAILPDKVVQGVNRLKDLELKRQAILRKQSDASSSASERRRLMDEAASSRRALQRFRWRSVVADNLDARVDVRSAGADRTSRAQMVEIVERFERERFWGILLCSSHYRHLDELRYLSDAVIELRVEDGGTSRTLTVHKIRPQPHDLGAHPFSIREGQGIRISPNLQSIQRANQRQPRPALDTERGYALPLEFSPRPERDTKLVDQKPAYPLEIVRSSWVLLYGPPQSGKGSFLYQLLTTPLNLTAPGKRDFNLGPTGRLLVVSFRSNEQEFMRRFVRDDKDMGVVMERLSGLDVRWYSPGDALRPADIARELVERVRRSHRDSFAGIEVVVFDSIDGIRTSLPKVHADTSFWSTMFALLAGEGVTTYFVTSDDGTNNDFVAKHAQDMDYVFEFKRKHEESAVCVAALKRSPESSGSAVFAERDFVVEGSRVSPYSRPPGG